MKINGKSNLDWYSQNVPECFFELEIKENSIIFEGGSYSDLFLFDELKPGFHEKLWQRNVVELFITDNNIYHEFNFAPNNTWWHSSFSAPRVAIESKEFPIKQNSEINGKYWKIKAEIPFSTENINKFNVTWIISNPLKYISFADLPKNQLDFHQPEFFKDL